jgi:uncharacterized CHY-type Zn-finger protein
MYEMKNYVVTCKDKTCENGGIKIPVQAAAENPTVICGVCTKEITEIKLVEE